jgi:hypothetical protein
MGGVQSLVLPGPPPAAVPIPEDPYPTFEKGIDGLDRSAEECAKCVLTIPPNISVSSAKISREQGSITPQQCRQIIDDARKVANKEMTVATFKEKVKAGRYYEGSGTRALQFDPSKERTCTQIAVPEDKLDKLVFEPTSAGDPASFLVGSVLNEKKDVRAFPVSMGGNFSSNTKLSITPIIPFKYAFNGQEVVVKRLTLYHPCPLRVNNVQYDAVLSLNDAMDADTTSVLLIPIKGESFAGKQARFFSNLVPYISALLTPDPNTGEYASQDVPTGASWNLTTLLPVLGTSKGENICTEPFYIWTSGSTQYQKVYSPIERKYIWKPTGPQISYIMMENPVPMNSMDLQTLRRMPLTPPEQAIHPVGGDIFYQPKQCPKPKPKEPEPEPGQTGAALKETFENDRCDPFAGFADQADEKKITTETIFKVVLGILSALAVFIGVYFAIKFAASQKGDILKKIGDKIGNAIGGSGIKAMQKMTEGVAKAAQEVKPVVTDESKDKAREYVRKKYGDWKDEEEFKVLAKRAADDLRKEKEAESRLSKSLTTQKPTTKPVQSKQTIDKKQLRDLSQFKA